MAPEGAPSTGHVVRWRSTVWLRYTLTAPHSVRECRDLLERRIANSSGPSGRLEAKVSSSSFGGMMRLSNTSVEDAVESVLHNPDNETPHSARASVTFSGELHPDGAGTLIELLVQQQRSLWRAAVLAVIGGAIGGAIGAPAMFATILLVAVVASDVWGVVPRDSAARAAFGSLIIICTGIEVILVMFADLVFVIAWPVVYVAAGIAVLAPAADWAHLWRELAFRLHATTTAIAAVATLVAAPLIGPLGTEQDINNTVEALTAPAIGVAAAAMFGTKFVLVSAGYLLVPAAWIVAILGATERERSSNLTPADVIWAPWRWLAACGVLGYAMGVSVGMSGYRAVHGELGIIALVGSVVLILWWVVIFAWFPVYLLLWKERTAARRALLLVAVPLALAAPPLLAWRLGTGVAGAAFGWGAVVTLVLAVVSAVAGFSELRDIVTARRWPVARARVLVADVRAEKNGLRTFHKPYVEFSYRVADKDLVGTELAFYQKAYSRRDKAQSRLDRFAATDEVDAYVDPRDPSKAVLDPHGSADAWMMAIGVIGLSGFFLWVTSVLVGWM